LITDEINAVAVAVHAFDPKPMKLHQCFSLMKKIFRHSRRSSRGL